MGEQYALKENGRSDYNNLVEGFMRKDILLTK